MRRRCQKGGGKGSAACGRYPSASGRGHARSPPGLMATRASRCTSSAAAPPSLQLLQATKKIGSWFEGQGTAVGKNHGPTARGSRGRLIVCGSPPSTDGRECSLFSSLSVLRVGEADLLSKVQATQLFRYKASSVREASSRVAASYSQSFLNPLAT